MGPFSVLISVLNLTECEWNVERVAVFVRLESLRRE